MAVTGAWCVCSRGPLEPVWSPKVSRERSRSGRPVTVDGVEDSAGCWADPRRETDFLTHLTRNFATSFAKMPVPLVWLLVLTSRY